MSLAILISNEIAESYFKSQIFMLSIGNKRIIINSLFLYLRMFVIMAIGFYTYRVVLSVLGVSDYGLFNVIGGFVSLLAFFNSALSGCTQRFITIARGKNDNQLITKTFRVFLLFHIILVFVFLFIMEIFGYFIIENILNIPTERRSTAQFVFHFFLFAGCLDLFRALFDAILIAYEKMTFYAYLSMFETVLKLLIVYILLYIDSYDHLKTYAILYFLSSFCITIYYNIFCCKTFKCCKMRPQYNKSFFKEISIYTSWNAISHIGFLLSSQGFNIVLNIFYGTVLNAAYGIATQINGIVSKFITNIQNSISISDNNRLFKRRNRENDVIG